MKKVFKLQNGAYMIFTLSYHTQGYFNYIFGIVQYGSFKEDESYFKEIKYDVVNQTSDGRKDIIEEVLEENEATSFLGLNIPKEKYDECFKMHTEKRRVQA